MLCSKLAFACVALDVGCMLGSRVALDDNSKCMQVDPSPSTCAGVVVRALDGSGQGISMSTTKWCRCPPDHELVTLLNAQNSTGKPIVQESCEGVQFISPGRGSPRRFKFSQAEKRNNAGLQKCECMELNEYQDIRYLDIVEEAKEKRDPKLAEDAQKDVQLVADIEQELLQLVSPHAQLAAGKLGQLLVNNFDAVLHGSFEYTYNRAGYRKQDYAKDDAFRQNLEQTALEYVAERASDPAGLKKDGIETVDENTAAEIELVAAHQDRLFSLTSIGGRKEAAKLGHRLVKRYEERVLGQRQLKALR